uniref:Uncharacterized protein n=1 Tax=Panagrolaimus sp. ES5 TaxID=591445 RepID=A0AC34GDP4_9BILA
MDTSPAVSFVSKTSDSENADSKKNGKNVRFNDSIDICYIEICKDEKEFKKGKKPQKNIFGGITKKITRVNMYDSYPSGVDPRKIIEARERKFGSSFVNKSQQMGCASPPRIQRSSLGQSSYHFSSSNSIPRNQQSTSSFSSSNPTLGIQRQHMFNNSYNLNTFNTSKYSAFNSNVRTGYIPDTQYSANGFCSHGFQSSLNSSFSGSGIKYRA